MKCTVEKIKAHPFSDEMYFFEFDLPSNWEDFLKDFKNTIGHTKNNNTSYYSTPPKAPKKGWYLSPSKAQKVKVWVLANFTDVIWCGQTLKASDQTEQKTQQDRTSSFNDFVYLSSSPELDFLRVVLGNGIPKDKKIEVLKAIYKSVAKIAHPDKSGGNGQWMQTINVAYEKIMKQLEF